MTREEAAKCLQEIAECTSWKDRKEAAEMAIAALQHLSCYLDGPCEYQNKNIELPSCETCEFCGADVFCSYWGIQTDKLYCTNYKAKEDQNK